MLRMLQTSCIHKLQNKFVIDAVINFRLVTAVPYAEQEGTRPAKDKLERHGQERFAGNGTYLGRGGGGSSQQTGMASVCGPIRSRGRGMNKVIKSTTI